MKSQNKKDPNSLEVHDVLESALQKLWSVANDLSRIKTEKPQNYRVTIFGSARIQPGQALYEEARELAQRLTQMGCDIVTGGGPGLMQAANEGSHQGDRNNQSSSIGIRVELPFEQDVNPFVEELYVHETFFTRLHHFVRLSNAFVILNGGIGTTLESLLVWQLLQVRHIENIPLIFVGEMWHDLVKWSKKHMLQQPQLASPNDLEIPVCVNTIDQVLEALTPSIQTFQQS